MALSPKLANGVDEYRRQLALANGEAAKGSMTREFQARMQTTSAQWQISKNIMNEVAVVIGGALLPAVNSLMQSAAPMIERFAEFSRDHPGAIKGIVGSALALTGLRVATLAVGYAVTEVKGRSCLSWDSSPSGARPARLRQWEGSARQRCGSLVLCAPWARRSPRLVGDRSLLRSPRSRLAP